MIITFSPSAPSSRGLGRKVLILVTAVQIRLGPHRGSNSVNHLSKTKESPSRRFLGLIKKRLLGETIQSLT